MTDKPSLLICVLLVAGGILGGMLKKLSDLEAAGERISPLAYLKRAPYKAALTVVGAYLFVVACYYMGWLNPVVAILAGLSGSEAFETLRARADRQFRQFEERDL